eukprot:gene19719-21664_t
MAAISGQLAISLFSTLIVPPADPNLVCSPLSITSALALVAAGSKGKTLQEISKSLKWGEEKDDTLLAKALLTEAGNVTSCNLADGASTSSECPIKSANNMWLDNDLTLLETYRSFLKSFHVSIQQADFRKDSTKITSEVNEWVAKQTNQKIRDLFSSDQINQDTSAVIVNALYFKGQWAIPFDKTTTHDSIFHVSKTKQVPVKMMFHTDEYKYFVDRSKNCDVLELPYTSKSFRMILVVPHEIDGLTQVQSSLDLKLISSWINSVQSARTETIDVFLPRFKVSQKINLKEKLKQLGISALFTENADLSGISGSRNLYVSSAVHQAVIEVNEEGTEATSATGIGMNFMSLPTQLQVNKPFLFMIIHNETKSVLFIGRVADPSA